MLLGTFLSEILLGLALLEVFGAVLVNLLWEFG